MAFNCPSAAFDALHLIWIKRIIQVSFVCLVDNARDSIQKSCLYLYVDAFFAIVILSDIHKYKNIS